ncbi:MAG: 16S rRNA (guanine(527)-N(7))-methyltransferase RsmG [Campylobacter sp.]
MKIPNDFESKVGIFCELLTKFNKIHSLTNYKNFDEQINDSIAPLEFLEFSPKIAIDVGSGAGFPAIFLAMILKDCQWTLFEPNAKKSSFLNYVKVNLELENLSVKSEKIEFSKPFVADFITTRALMKTKEFLKLCKGFYDDETTFLLYKGTSVEAEISGLNAKIYSSKNRNYVIMKGSDVI